MGKKKSETVEAEKTSNNANMNAFNLERVKPEEVRDEARKLLALFEGSFINNHLEFIACSDFWPQRWSGVDKLPATSEKKKICINAFFSLEDCKNEGDVAKKILYWLSKAASGDISWSWDRQTNALIAQWLRDRCNRYLGTRLTAGDWTWVYCYIGNGINEPLAEKFIGSGYDLAVLQNERKPVYYLDDKGNIRRKKQ